MQSLLSTFKQQPAQHTGRLVRNLIEHGRGPLGGWLHHCVHHRLWSEGVPSDRHAQPSTEPADGSQLAPPPPPARGAAASSSPPSAVISPLICAPQQLYAVRSDLYIGVVLEITTPARGQEMGTRTGNFPVLPPLRACMRGQEIGILLKQPLTDRRISRE